MPQKFQHESIGEVVIHPVFPHAFASVEHAEGELTALGDALGRDCWVMRFRDGWYRLHADDGTFILYAHIDQVAVQPGDAIKAGQPVAKVGNNGTSQCPHLHIGAWRGDTPLQIRFDLRALGHLQTADPDRYFGYDLPR